MNAQYWVEKINELEQSGRYDQEGICPVCGISFYGDTAEETYELMERHRHDSMKVVFDAFDIVEKTVKPEGNSGRVYIPRSWVGKRVKVVLLEPL